MTHFKRRQCLNEECRVRAEKSLPLVSVGCAVQSRCNCRRMNRRQFEHAESFAERPAAEIVSAEERGFLGSSEVLQQRVLITLPHFDRRREIAH